MSDWGDTPAKPDPAEAPTADDPNQAPARLVYGSTDEFVREYLRHMYRRPVTERTSRVWAADWWRYEEAVARLEALWRAWEHLRLEAGTGISTWWREHADHHMPLLMDPEGPFAASDRYDPANQADKGQPLPYIAPKPGLFPDVRISTTTTPETDPADSGPAGSPDDPEEPADAEKPAD